MTKQLSLGLAGVQRSGGNNNSSTIRKPGSLLNHAKRTEAEAVAAKVMLWFAGLLTLFILAAIISHILGEGLGVINLRFLLEEPKRMGREGGIFSTIVGTFALTSLAILLATPVSVGAAVYLTEYVKKGRLVRIIRFGTECLAGIPSIIFGLFGYVFFVDYLGFGWSLLSGGLTLMVMILPTIIRTAEEAIKAVPNSYREGSLALGATKWQTVRRVVLPAAIPGIVTGVILGIGRAIGETAAVILTAGSSLRIPTSLFDPLRTMSVHLYIVSSEGLSKQASYGTATVLIVAIFLINFITGRLMGRFAASFKSR